MASAIPMQQSMDCMRTNMKKGRVSKLNHFSAGLTLVELLVSVSLLVLIAGFFVVQQVESVKMQKAENIAQELMTVAAASTSHYVNTRAWPDQNGNCTALLTALQNANVFPAGYSPFSGLVLTSDCNSSATASQDFGRILRLVITFPYIDRDYAALVASLIPTSNLVIPAPTASNPGPNVTVEHYLFPPRRHTLPPFRVVELQTDARFRVQKPPCHTSPQLLLIPQSLCLTDPSGFGGYYFHLESETNGTSNTPGEWRYQLRVTPGDVRSFKPMEEECTPGQKNRVGVVTYCE